MLGGLGKQAVFRATLETFQATHTNVAQALVQNDPRIPMAQFKALTEQYLAHFLQRNLDLDWEYDLSDLSIRQAGNGPGAYQIIDANTGIGLVGFDGFQFSTSSLEQWGLERREAEREAALDETVAASAETEAARAEAEAAEDALRRASDPLGEAIGMIP